jgi:hypothetical protein
MEHPEIPVGVYCYGKGGVCPHWHRTEKGARCDILNEEHVAQCMFHLIWDQVKECGINKYEEGEEPYKNPTPFEGVHKTVTCDCGRQVETIIRRNKRCSKETHDAENS